MRLCFSERFYENLNFTIAGRGGERSERPPRRNDDGGGEGDFKETLMVQAKLCGRIVGSGGSVIQELQSEYNVKINIDREADEVGLRLIN